MINELSATHSDRLLVREAGEYPRVGNTIPWQRVEFDDSAWGAGDGPFGFGNTGSVSLGTNVGAEVQGKTPSLYLRKSFTVTPATAASGSSLELAVRYNDGFIAYLNGVEVARRHMGFAGMFFYRDQPAASEHSSTALETIDLGVASDLLQAGENLLSIQVHNQSASGGDLLMAANLALAGGPSVVDGTTLWRYFAGLAEPSGGLVDYGLLGREADVAPDVLWATTSFDDSTWTSGVGPVGYDVTNPPDYLLGVDLAAEMRNMTPSVYVRRSFTATAAEADSAFPLSLEVDYDDGMIVYLNGVEIYRGNIGTAGTVTEHSATADGSHPASGDGGNPLDRSETIPLDEARNLLITGDNVLGIQIHNSGTGSSDLVGLATLTSTGASPRTFVAPTDPVRYFVGTDEPDAEAEVGLDDVGTIEDPPDSENDWIEIYNPSGVAVSLAGWSLSDDAGNPRKWDFPAGAVIPANGYYLVIASNLELTPAADGTTYPHTSFQLSASGERVLLTRPDGQISDQFAADYPAQTWRYTYGRQGDGSFGFLSLGTPGSANMEAGLAVAPEAPELSVPGSFYPGALSLSLTSSTPGATIRYTTDGSDPLDGIVYSAPLAVTDNTVIRARSFLSGSIPSQIVTHSYLINEGSAYRSLPAMCLSGDPARTFYGPNTAGGPANGEGIFAINGGAYTNGVWDANDEATAFNHAAGSGRSNEKYGALEYLPLTGEPLRTELGMRVAGSGHTRKRLKISDPMDVPFTSNSTSSTKFEKPSMNIFFRPEFGERPLNYPFFGSKTVSEFDSLRVRAGKNDWYNPFIKDELMRRLFINSGQVGSYGTIHTLWINGVYKGYYNTAERIREGFMQVHYNSEESWDVQQVNRFSSGDPTNWNKMIDYLRTADLTSIAGYAGVHDYLDVDNYIDYILVNAYAAMGDWPHNNWIAARERSSVGRWRFYVWDAEGSFGFAGRNSVHNTFTSELTIADAQTTSSLYIPAIYTLLKDSPEFRLRMADRAQKQLFNGGALQTSEITKVYDELREEVTPIIEETIGGAFRTSWYTGWIENSTRYNAMLSQLSGEGAWSATEAPTFNQYGGEISQGFELTLGNPNSGGTIYYTTDGSDPRALGGSVVGTSYAAPIALAEDTRVRARVLEAGTWSPEVDSDFALPLAHPTFLPLVSADWTDSGNWSSSPGPYPDGGGVTAVVPGVEGASRNVNLRAPVTVGRLTFDLANAINRSRVRDRDSGNSLTFLDPSGESEILVTGEGEGYAELEVEAGVVLTNDLRIDVRHQSGDSEHGALRLRAGWSGSGGLIMSGSGIASLTGQGKAYSGATLVENGVLQISEPASPSMSSSIVVSPGGQLRLTSGTDLGEAPRNYLFGGPLVIEGFGRGSEISDGEGNGKLGALRYEPGGSENEAVISSAVSLSGPADIHVVGATNRLVLAMPLGGSHEVTKSGGGTLTLAGDQSELSYPIAVQSGTLEIQGVLGSSINLAPTATLRGYGRTAAITGEGALVLEQTLVHAPTSSASHYSFVFSTSGGPNLAESDAALNATAMLENPPTGVLSLDFYLTGTARAVGAVSQGGFIVPYTADLENALSSAVIRVFSQDSSGSHEFAGQAWSLVPKFQLTSVAAQFGPAAPSSQVRILELTNGPGAPTSFEDWRQVNFSAVQLVDPLVSGPLASPLGDGVENLLRYAFGVPFGEKAEGFLPQLGASPAGFAIDFPFESGRDDIIVRVESSETLEDWSAATILFDSALDFPPATDGQGRIRINDPRPKAVKRFYRLRIVEK